MKKAERKVKIKIKRDDEVVVISGNYKGQRGKVLSVDARRLRAVVSGIAMVRKHIKARSADEKSRIVDMEAPVHISNLMYYEGGERQGVRLGRKRDEQGTLRRFSRKSGKFIG